MWNSWSNLCNKNVKHYNEKPVEHAAIIAALGVTFVGAMALVKHKLSKKSNDRQFRPTMK